jgi:hypothetical protein
MGKVTIGKSISRSIQSVKEVVIEKPVFVEKEVEVIKEVEKPVEIVKEVIVEKVVKEKVDLKHIEERCKMIESNLFNFGKLFVQNSEEMQKHYQSFKSQLLANDEYIKSTNRLMEIYEKEIVKNRQKCEKLQKFIWILSGVCFATCVINFIV